MKDAADKAAADATIEVKQKAAAATEHDNQEKANKKTAEQNAQEAANKVVATAQGTDGAVQPPTQPAAAIITNNPQPTQMANDGCSDESGWDKHCPILAEHCPDYETMKINCKKTCGHCKNEAMTPTPPNPAWTVELHELSSDETLRLRQRAWAT